MQKNRFITLAIVCLSIFGATSLCFTVWADGASQTGGSSAGNGSVPTCASNSGDIHEPSCGVDGGGKSWRVYKITQAVINAVNDKDTTADKQITALNKNATWKISNGGYNGTKITGSKGVLKTCVKNNAPYIVILGLNRVVSNSNKDKLFYVAFRSSKVNGDCGNNRGCYYDWNNYNAINKSKNVSGASNGRIVTNTVAKALYKKAFDGSTTGFGDTGAFCSWDPNSEEYTLTAKSVDTSGNSLASITGLADVSDDAISGETASVNHGSNDKYTFVKWSSNASGTDNLGTGAAYSRTMTSDYTVYAVYQKIQYTLTAKSVDMSGTSLADVTGLGNSSKTVDKGGSATVSHGNTETGYTFKCWSSSSNTGCNSSAGTGASYTVNPMNNHVTIYAVYQPYSATSTLSMQIKNYSSTVAAYKDYTSPEVYAKPGDKIGYKVVYTPLAQGAVNLKPQYLSIDGGTAQANDATPSTLRVLFNNKKSTSWGVWSNSLMIGDGLGKYTNPFAYDVGVTDSKTIEATEGGSPGIYEIPLATAGVKLTQGVSLQKNASGTTPKSVSVSVSGGKSLATVRTGLNASVSAIIPLNFVNTTRVLTPEDTLMYAGESAEFKIGIMVNKRHSNVLDSDYATKVPGAKWKIGISYDGGSSYSWGEVMSDTLNKTGKLEPTDEDEESKELSITIPDISAGSRICIKSAVYPKDSNGDTNLIITYDANQDSSWAYSTEKCYRVAKRPNLQVLGGNIYTSSNISTALSQKRHLSGYNGYSTTLGNSDMYFFGSWGELGVVSFGKVTNFASGAGLGYLSNSDGEIWPNSISNDSTRGDRPGGYHGGYDYCKLSLLTLANEVCKNSNNTAGNIGSNSATNGIEGDRNAIMNLVEVLSMGESAAASDGIISINADTAKYYDINSSLSISGGTLPKNKKVLIHASEDITITGNINYEQTGYNNLLETPKVVIYSDKNILIGCNGDGVTRIDAVLLADKVITCDNYVVKEDGSRDYMANINQEMNSKQLVVYGAIIANQLEANRTYGAATGVNSMVPAEIIDFDPTLYLWSGFDNEEDDFGEPEDGSKDESTFDSVYLRELAPRF